MKKTLTVLCLFIALGGCIARQHEYAATSARPMETPAKMQQKPPLQAAPGYIDIWLDCGAGRIGAYSLEIHYDRSVVAVSKVLPVPGELSGKAAVPMSREESYRTGATRIIGIYPGGSGPGGRVPVARVHFSPVAAGTSKVSVSVRSVYSSENVQMPAVVELSRNEVSVR